MAEVGGREQRLHASVEGDELVIRIGISTLAFAFDNGDENRPWNDEHQQFIQMLKVTDKLEFAKDVVYAMTNEKEDGSTPLSDFVDQMFRNAVEAGSVAVDECGAICEG